MLRNLSTCVLFLLLGTPLAALAQGTGTLAGNVTDDAGETLIGASVLVVGTGLGAATDIDGNYRIIGIPVGAYTVTASYTGFQSSSVEAVQVSSGLTTDQDFVLGTQEIGEIEVVYQRPIIENDAIGVPRVVSQEDLQNLPVRGVANVASLQGGVVSTEGSSNLNIRGGREQEVAYYVDGVKVIGSAPVGVNQGAIQEQEMLIGTIPARYGDVQGGVISITTRTGREEFFGSAELITSEVLDSFGYNLASLSVGGPIVPGRVGFFLSGQGQFEADQSPFGVSTFRLSDESFASLQANPEVVPVTNEAGETRYVAFPWEAVANYDGFVTDAVLATLLDVPDGFSFDPAQGNPFSAAETFTAEDFELERGKDDPLSELTFNGNLNFDLSRTLSLRLGGGYFTRDRENFSFTRSLYNRDRITNTEQDSYRLYGTFRQRVSDNAFYQIQGEFQDFNAVTYPDGFSADVEDVLRYGDVDDPNNEVARRYYVRNRSEDTNGDGVVTSADAVTYSQQYFSDGGSRPGSVIIGGFSTPGQPINTFNKSHDQQIRFSGSATTQLGVNQLEFGGEFEQQTRRFYSLATANGLAAFVNDDDGPEGDVLGLPRDENNEPIGVDSYDQLPYEAFREIATYWGYDYRGLNEVDDEDIDAFFERNPETGERGNANVAPYRPQYYAGYVQDKIEFQDLVINLGMRVDVFDNNTLVLRDIYAPRPIVRVEDLTAEQIEAEFGDGGVPTGIDSEYAVYFAGQDIVGFRDIDGNFFSPDGTEIPFEDVTGTASGQVRLLEGAARSDAFEDYEAQVTVMPRVGVSFPVTDRALFFASYNVTSQRPTEQAFAPFTFYERLEGQDSRVPNPRLEPERTTQYELGFRQRLGERAALTLSGFYRTQENKISNRTLYGGFPAYGTYLNADFTTTSGVEAGFDLRRSRNLAITANYTLSFAQGTGSDANATATIVWRGNYFPQSISPADFDQRHTANFSVDYRFADDEGPMIGGMRLLENFGINFLGQLGSGQRYTALTGSRAVNDSFTETTVGSINSATLPATSRFDLRVDRAFNVGFRDATLKAYLWVQNLFDTQNVLAVYRATGVPDEDGYLSTEGGQGALLSVPDRDGSVFNYSAYTSGPLNIGGSQSSGAGLFYGLPRRIRLGLLFNF